MDSDEQIQESLLMQDHLHTLQKDDHDHEMKENEAESGVVGQEAPNDQDPPDQEQTSSTVKKLFKHKNIFTVRDRIDFGAYVAKCKEDFDSKTTTHYDAKRKKWVKRTPKEGFHAKAIRSHFEDLKDKHHNDKEFKSACEFSSRCLALYEKSLDGEVGATHAKRVRVEGAGRKAKATDFRDELFEWFIDVRTCLKGRLPRPLFINYAKDLYADWMSRQPNPVPESQMLKFSNPWIQSWMNEYGVSLKKPNKRYAISQSDRVQRLLEYLKNVYRIRIFFYKKYGVQPIFINGDQMPLHRNESSGLKTMNMKNQDTYVKENYMLSRERITCFTQFSSDDKLKLSPEFVFKGVGTRTKLNPPTGVFCQWAEKGSYKLEHMIKTIEHLPNRKNLITQSGYAVYVLDDYSVHCMPAVRDALLERGYILVVMGGGITGDIQINDTHFHAPLKSNYRKLETDLMLRKLKEDRSKIPTPSKDEIMTMLVTALQNVTIDSKTAFKELFVTNDLNGSEDHMVSDKLFSLIGREIQKFRNELMLEDPPKNLQELIKKITPPKGVKRKNVQGSELFDCEGDEIEQSNFEALEIEDVAEESSNVNEAVTEDDAGPKITSFSLTKATNDAKINMDATFADQLQSLIENHETSNLFIPYVSELKATHQKARRQLKRRIDQYLKKQQTAVTAETSETSESENFDTFETLFDDNDATESEVKPKKDEFWKIRNGRSGNFLYTLIVGENPLEVKYFEPTVKGKHHCLNEAIFDAFIDDLEEKVEPPKVIKKGKREYYSFV